MRTTILSRDDIRTIVARVGSDRLMDLAIDGLTTACREFALDNYEVPARDGFKYEMPQTGLLEWMPALKIGSRATLKTVGYHPHNPSRLKLPTILSVALSFDTETGHLLGMVDGTFLTAVRTGAASAVASRVLAREDARILGLVGAGTQAVTQLHALTRVFALNEVLVHDIDPATRDNFPDRVRHLGGGRLHVRPATLADIKRRADVICTATSIEIGEGPVFDDGGLQPHVHINAVGSDFPGKTELPGTLLRRALVCPDFRVQAVKEGECQQLSPVDIGPDLVALTASPHDYAGYRDRCTVFDSTGWALEDHVMMEIFVAQARELGCGTAVEVEAIGDDPKNPYAFLSRDFPAHADDDDDGARPLYAID